MVRTEHTAEKHRPTMFHTAIVRPKRSGPGILYNTSLRCQDSYELSECHRPYELCRHTEPP